MKLGRTPLIIGASMLVLFILGAVAVVQVYSAYRADRHARTVAGQQREAEIDRMIDEMRRQYPPGTDVQEIVRHFEMMSIPYHYSDSDVGPKHKCPCVKGFFSNVYLYEKPFFSRTHFYIVIMIDSQNRVVGIVKSSATAFY
jgi:hypothetical protein